jgi:PAS domain S-box-containing protein
MVLAEIFIPHGHCYLWKPSLVGLHVASDAAIALAYYSIPLMLIYFVEKRRDIPFNWIFQLFSAFIIACGTTHILNIWTLWHPTYWVSGFTKAITAVVSLCTAGALVPLLPKALALPSPAQLEAVNQELEKQIDQYKRIEEVLRDRERRFRAIFNQSFQFIGLLKPDGTLLEANQTALDFAGLVQTDVVERPFWETRWWMQGDGEISTQLPANTALSPRPIAKALLPKQEQLRVAIARAAAGDFVRYEVDVRGAGDTRATIDFSLKPVRDETGQVVLLIPEGRDITERIQMEDVLRESEERFRLAFRHAAVGMALVAPDGRFLKVNRALCEIIGYSQSELLGTTFQTITYPDDLNIDLDYVRQMLADEIRTYQMEKRYVHKFGYAVWVSLSVSLVRNAQGEAVHFISQVQDITERKRVEKLLADYNRTLEAQVAERTTQLTDANEQLEREIAERRQAEAALQKAKEAADTANRAKSKFLANMTHELRTPLNAILGFTRLLDRDSNLTSSQHEQLSIINRSGEHLLELINDVLEMSKIEAGRTQLNPNSFDLYSLLESLVGMLQLKAQVKGLQLSLDVTQDVPQFIFSDESKLRQVLINLLENAIKFTQEGGITLQVIKESNVERFECCNLEEGDSSTRQSVNLPEQIRIRFAVEDTGSGIATEELGTLFDAFVQTETGRKTQEGTGLGLAISKRFVELMGGELTVNSTLGQGTTVDFDILATPVRASDVYSKPPRERALSLAPNQPSYRILVVEDIWENRYLLVKLLEPLGFEVLEATNGQEAVDVWESWKPHLILMDMRMPVMNGYEATKWIRKAEVRRVKDEKVSGSKFQLQNPEQQTDNSLHTSTVIIAVTASAFNEEREIVISAGCNDFIRKPFRESVLLEKIAQYLGVCYVYEDSAQPSSLQAGEKVEILTKEALLAMPPEWLSQLHLTALGADNEEILKLVEQIPKSQAALKSSLVDLVNNFRLDLIIDLTETCIED